MRPSRAPSVSVGTALVFGLAFLPTVLAHGDDGGGHDGDDHMDMGMDAGMDKPQDDYPPTYFAHPDHAGLMYGHIGLMVVAWVFILPVGMFSLTSSSLLCS